ncbi:MAG: site-2 protease family protein [Patescibacteria group bacterium]|nr:site-2 protease family protein [Patescibacteria group bacterium]MCL5224306.1 site-2 protease family protein [Patescibacteria group bacterium]
MDTTIIVIFQLIVLLFSVIVHEVTHGVVALSLGDSTAKDAGRLTLNPLRHMDPIGSFLLPLILAISGLPVLGWAKPVPYNPNNLYKDYRYGPLKVAIAGPISNLSLAIIFAVVVRLLGAVLSDTMVALLGFVILLNIILAVFNLLPIPPLDGSKLISLISPRFSRLMETTGLWGLILVLLFLFFFSQYIFIASAAIFQLLAGAHAAAIFASFSGI